MHRGGAPCLGDQGSVYPRSPLPCILAKAQAPAGGRRAGAQARAGVGGTAEEESG